MLVKTVGEEAGEAHCASALEGPAEEVSAL